MFVASRAGAGELARERENTRKSTTFSTTTPITNAQRKRRAALPSLEFVMAQRVCATAAPKQPPIDFPLGGTVRLTVNRPA